MKVTYDIQPIEPSDSSRREREKKAVGMLIQKNIAPEARISHLPNGAPFISGSSLSISISHSMHYAALAWGEEDGFGIDIEEPRKQQIEQVAHRFLSKEEQIFYSNEPDGLLKAWTLKEAAFKAVKNGPPNFKEYHLPIAEGDNCILLGHRRLLILFSGMIQDDLCLAIVACDPKKAS